MNLILDNIIFPLQKSGGISVVWYELLQRILNDSEFNSLFLEAPNNNIFREKLAITTDRILYNPYSHYPINLQRFLNPNRLKEKGIFHSSYYRTINNPNSINIATVHDFTYEHFRSGFTKLIHHFQTVGDWETSDCTNEPDHIDKKVYILRPCMIHGPGNKGNLNLLFKIQQKGLPWPLGAFENKRSFCSIYNILFVVQQLITENIEPGIYQVADDEALSTNELIRLMALSQNKNAKIWHIPVQLIKTIALLGDFLHLPLNSERLRKLTESYVVSNKKIKKALSVSQLPLSAQEGMKKTLVSLK